jgi:hypothetical protein
VWLLKKKPVWSMVIYTDEVVWKKKVPDSFFYAFSQEKQRQFFHFDVIIPIRYQELMIAR